MPARLAGMTRDAAASIGADVVDMVTLSISNDARAPVTWINGRHPPASFTAPCIRTQTACSRSPKRSIDYLAISNRSKSGKHYPITLTPKTPVGLPSCPLCDHNPRGIALGGASLPSLMALAISR